MAEALVLAHEAAAAGEVPVGCIIVREGEVVGRGRNRREEKQSTASHAEMEAIAQANATLDSWRLEDCELYVTLEPCAMCTGAIINSRIKLVVFCAEDWKAGAMGGMCDLTQLPFNHKPEVIIGVMEDEGRQILKDFFKETKTITSNKDQRFKNIFKVIKNHEEISLLQNILTYLCENKYHSKIDDIKNLKNNSKK